MQCKIFTNSNSCTKKCYCSTIESTFLCTPNRDKACTNPSFVKLYSGAEVTRNWSIEYKTNVHNQIRSQTIKDFLLLAGVCLYLEMLSSLSNYSRIYIRPYFYFIVESVIFPPTEKMCLRIK